MASPMMGSWGCRDVTQFSMVVKDSSSLLRLPAGGDGSCGESVVSRSISGAGVCVCEERGGGSVGSGGGGVGVLLQAMMMVEQAM